MKQSLLIFSFFGVFLQNLVLAQGPALTANWAADTINQFDDAVLYCQGGGYDIYFKIDTDTNWYNLGPTNSILFSGCRPDTVWLRIDSSGITTTILTTYIQDNWVEIPSWTVDTTGLWEIEATVTNKIKYGYTIMVWWDTTSVQFFTTDDTTISIAGYPSGTYSVEVEVWESDSIGDFGGRYTQLCAPYVSLVLISSSIVISSATIEIRVYPNPNHGQFFLEGISVGEYLSITNLLGKVVYSQIATTSTVLIDSNLPSGVYFLSTENCGVLKIIIH